MSNYDSEIIAAIANKQPSSTGWYRAECPACLEEGHRDTKGSLSVSAKTGFFTCWRCGIKGKADLGYYGEVEIKPPDPTQLMKPEGWEPLTENNFWSQGISIQPAIQYWRGRAGPRAGRLAAQLEVGACLTGKRQGRIIVPLREDGQWVGWVGRDYTGQAKLKYIYPAGMARVMFNRQCLQVETDKPSLVVEGVFDAIRYYPNVVACLGKPSQWQIEEMEQAKRPVVVALDGDAWQEGWALAERLKIFGSGPGYGFVQIPPGEDPGSIDPAWLVQAATESLQGTGE